MQAENIFPSNDVDLTGISPISCFELDEAMVEYLSCVKNGLFIILNQRSVFQVSSCDNKPRLLFVSIKAMIPANTGQIFASKHRTANFLYEMDLDITYRQLYIYVQLLS